MSETITEDRPAEGEAVSVADLQRMLDEYKTKATTLEQERDHERERASRFERERDDATTNVQTEQERAYGAEVRAVGSALTAAQSDMDRAKAALRAAREAGDFDAEAEAQEAIADAAQRRFAAKSKQEYLEQNKERFTAKPAAARPVGRYADLNVELLPDEETWLDKRPQFRSDAGYRQEVFGASQIAAKRHGRGTQGYFREMERILGEEAAAEQTTQTPAPRARQQSADLPAGGQRQPGAQPRGGQEINLTAEQRDMADTMYGPSSQSPIADPAERYKKYWTNMQRMRESGRMA